MKFINKDITLFFFCFFLKKKAAVGELPRKKQYQPVLLSFPIS